MSNLMVDIDDVLFPLAPGLHRKAHELGLHDNTEEALRVWHGWQQYGCAKEKWLEVFEALHAEDYYLKAEPYRGAVRALRELYWEGHTINLVTARGFMARAGDIRRWTHEWVEDHAIPGRVTFAKDKVAAQASLGRFDFAIDDGTHNYLALRADGVNVSLLTVPHNEDDHIPANERVSSVEEWADYIRACSRWSDWQPRWVAGVPS